MTKFDLKKIIAENKATFFSSLDEDKKEYYRKAEADDAEHIDALEKDMKDDKKLSEVLRSKEEKINNLVNYFAPRDLEMQEKYKSVFDKFNLDGKDNAEDIVAKMSEINPKYSNPNSEASYSAKLKIQSITGTPEEGPSSKEVYPNDYGLPAFWDRNNENQTTMTKEALKAKIKEMILAELNEEDGAAVTNSNYDFVVNEDENLNENAFTDIENKIKSGKIKPEEVEAAAKKAKSGDTADLALMMAGIGKMAEAKKEDEEATDAPEATDIEVSAEETPTSDSFEVSTSEVDPTIKAIQDALTQAQAAAQKLGDEKLTDQIGNTITFFTRTHVANKDVAPVAEQLDEAFINKMKHRAGIIK